MALPEYTIRQSPRAKNIRLKVTPEDGLCVVVPRGFDVGRIPEILKRKKVWIADTLAEAKSRRRFLEPNPATHLPDRLELRAIGEIWKIVYREGGATRGLHLRARNGELLVVGASFDRDAVIAKLNAWLRTKVRSDLFPLASQLAEKNRLPISGLMVKSQRTRWASCSAKKNLSLNTKLLFLPSELVRYAIVHELCHTVHMNHSREFWVLVACHEPRYRSLDEQLRAGWKLVPQWAFSTRPTHGSECPTGRSTRRSKGVIRDDQ